MHHPKRLLALSAIVLALIVAMASQHAFAGSVEDFENDDSVTGETAVNARELLVIDVDRSITKSDRGFPRNDPPRSAANGNWKTPVNYAEGTLHFRVQIRSQPRPQNMRIQFCVWQDRFYLENCGSMQNVYGSSGTVVTWSQPVQDMWRLGGRSIDWSRPRQRYGFAIKNAQGQPVSDYNGWNWNGENPNNWYPLDARMTVVVVEKGGSFSGWSNYGGSGGGGGGGGTNPTPTPTPRPTNTPAPSAPTPTPTPISGGGGGGNTCSPATNSVVKNGSFENNFRTWRFYNKEIGVRSITNSAYECSKAAQIKINQSGKNIQLYQTGIRLEANTRYRLTFAAKASRGQDLGVYLHKHSRPYTDYGLDVDQVNLSTNWQLFTTEFTTRGFSGSVDDARLRFWLAPWAQAGDTYWIDGISLVKVGVAAASDAPAEPSSSLIGLDEPEFDPSVIDLIANGNDVHDEAFIEEIYLPSIQN